MFDFIVHLGGASHWTLPSQHGARDKRRTRVIWDAREEDDAEIFQQS